MYRSFLRLEQGHTVSTNCVELPLFSGNLYVEENEVSAEIRYVLVAPLGYPTWKAGRRSDCIFIIRNHTRIMITRICHWQTNVED